MAKIPLKNMELEVSKSHSKWANPFSTILLELALNCKIKNSLHDLVWFLYDVVAHPSTKLQNQNFVKIWYFIKMHQFFLKMDNFVKLVQFRALNIVIHLHTEALIKV